MDELMTWQTTSPVRLCEANLERLPNHVARPNYDRKSLRPGIVHIGLGNFHRAHQAWYLHRLMQQGKAHDWAIIGASVRHEDAAQRRRLLNQDCLTTLIELDPSGTCAEVIGSIVDYLPIEEEHGPLVRQMADPAIRIVSLTVTEGGYFLDPATKQFDPTHPDTDHDARNIDRPRTVFGAIISALKSRRANGLKPFTCQSCDNLPGNGRILSEVIVELAEMVDPSLGAWISENARFPNAMVDCIVPATGPDELAKAKHMGVLDEAPVTHENFRQWVMEDAYCAGRPAWEDVGVTIAPSVHDYEAMKLRLLNGGHQIIAAPAELLGLTTIAEAMQHPGIAGFFRKLCKDEIAPFVPSVPQMSPDEYIDLIAKRFENPAVNDTVRRVAFDGSSRHTGSVIPTIRDAIAKGTSLRGLALSQALWAFMCTGMREDGSRIAPNDPVWDQLQMVARSAEKQPLEWLRQRSYYGEILNDDRFASAFSSAFRELQNDGVTSAIMNYANASSY